MNRVISSETTIFWKIIFPWVFIIFTVCYAIPSALFEMKYIVLLFSIICSIILWKLFGAIKKVTILDQEMIVSNYIKKVRIPLSDICEIKHKFLANKHRIELKLKKSSTFGSSILFIPAGVWWPYKTHPLVDEIKSLLGDK